MRSCRCLQGPTCSFEAITVVLLSFVVSSRQNLAYYRSSDNNSGTSSSWYQNYQSYQNYYRHQYSTQSNSSSYVAVSSSDMHSGQAAPACDTNLQGDLTQRLKSKGLFDLRYMATSLQQALQTFPDFTDSRFLQPSEAYYCDDQCQRRTEEIRAAFKAKNNFGRRSYTFAKIPIEVKPFQPKFEATSPVNVPQYSSGNYNPYNNGYASSTYGTPEQHWSKLSANDNTANQNIPRYGQNGQLGSFAFNTPNVNADYPTHLFTQKWRIFRSKRSRYNEEAGTDYIISCKKAGTEEKPGYHSICGSCRVIRKLSSQYFPRYLNEVICGESLCISGGGKCAQQYIPVTILRNKRTPQCPQWVPVSMIVSCCCNCLLSGSMSDFLDVFPSK
ncbi:unnamed protein product [Soboliphyme baturini]|uniref:Spaetzle domain-containing protein n=1 Tax=Soboliphyme baturini TaxID=241478 RepID=A0A183IRD9_9BILA|nr:unnamed protein product [Soboliphyme baturini]